MRLSRLLRFLAPFVLCAAPAPAAAGGSEEARLNASNAAANQRFGESVDISGDLAVVGRTAGGAYAFARSGSVWTEEAFLTGGTGTNQFGHASAISGDTIVVGAWLDNAAASGGGAAYVFIRNGGAWTLQQRLTASDAQNQDHFGYSVDISGDTIIVGSDEDDDNGSNAGSAYIYQRVGTVWVEQAKLIGSDTAAGDLFAWSVSIDGDTAVCGAILDDDNGNSSGSAYVFTRSGSSWTEQTKLTGSGNTGNDQFGYDVDNHGDRVVVGAYQDDAVGPNTGSVYVFRRDGVTWTEEDKLNSASPNDIDRFGFSVGIHGDTVVCGSPRDDDNLNNSGAVHVFYRSGTTWNPGPVLHATDAGEFDNLGYFCAVNGDSVIGGAPQDDEGGSNSGSAYVFRLNLVEPGTALCFGDGTGTACPCGNDSATAGEGCLHSGGVGMTISGSGSTSISADDLTVTADGCPPNNSGIFYSGRTSLAPGNTLYDGVQCAGGDVRRYQGLFQTGGSVSDTGFVAQDPSGVYFVAGATYYFQYWSRDVALPGPCATGANFSPSYAVTMTP